MKIERFKIRQICRTEDARIAAIVNAIKGYAKVVAVNPAHLAIAYSNDAPYDHLFKHTYNENRDNKLDMLKLFDDHVSMLLADLEKQYPGYRFNLYADEKDEPFVWVEQKDSLNILSDDVYIEEG